MSQTARDVALFGAFTFAAGFALGQLVFLIRWCARTRKPHKSALTLGGTARYIRRVL